MVMAIQASSSYLLLLFILSSGNSCICAMFYAITSFAVPGS